MFLELDLGHADLDVVRLDHIGLLEEAAHRLGRLRADREPLLDRGRVEVGLLLEGVVPRVGVGVGVGGVLGSVLSWSVVLCCCVAETPPAGCCCNGRCSLLAAFLLLPVAMLRMPPSQPNKRNAALLSL